MHAVGHWQQVQPAHGPQLSGFTPGHESCLLSRHQLMQPLAQLPDLLCEHTVTSLNPTRKVSRPSVTLPVPSQ